MDQLLKILVFIIGLVIVFLTLSSALSTFVVPRGVRSQLNRIVFGLLRRLFHFLLHFTKTYERRDAIMAYYAPLGLMLLLPTWYILILIGYAAIYWSVGVGDLFAVFRISGSSLFTLGFDISKTPLVTAIAFSEAMLGLMLVGLLIAYLPTMYSAFSRREQVVNMLEVRAGSPPSAVEMLLRFHRNHGLDKLSEYWNVWESWFADTEESHTTLPALIFFRSPRAENSWVTAGGAVLDAAAITLSAVAIPYEVSAALCIRSGFLAFRRIANYFDIPNPQDPHFPQHPICVDRAEFDSVLDQLAAEGLPLYPDREKAWRDFAGWRVNYDRSLILLCGLVMAPQASWSSDRAPQFHMTPLMIWKKHKSHLEGEAV
jgi:hypothetical protein